jgi:hypothetical protein
MRFISILSVAVLALIVVVIYSVRLQRRAIATQERLALGHHHEKQKRDRFYASVPDDAMPNNAFHSDGAPRHCAADGPASLRRFSGAPRGLSFLSSTLNVHAPAA